VNLFKAAPFCEGVGASVGGAEIAEGVTEGAPAGESEGGDGGEAMPFGEGDGPFTAGAGGDDNGDSADGESTGDGELRGVATGVLFGERAGDDAGD